MNYERINWENAPSTDTPLDADNLNKMDEALDTLNREVAKTRSDVQEVEETAASLGSQIAGIIRLEDGSTTGDAELINGRVGKDGTTYPVIGDAIRGQIGDLRDHVIEVSDEEPEEFYNKIWVKDDDQEIEIPIKAELDAVEDKVDELNERLDAEIGDLESAISTLNDECGIYVPPTASGTTAASSSNQPVLTDLSLIKGHLYKYEVTYESPSNATSYLSLWQTGGSSYLSVVTISAGSTTGYGQYQPYEDISSAYVALLTNGRALNYTVKITDLSVTKTRIDDIEDATEQNGQAIIALDGEVDSINHLVDGYEESGKSQFWLYNNKWYKNNFVVSYIIPVNSSDSIKLRAQSGHVGYYTILSTIDNMAAGNTPDYATGYSGSVSYGSSNTLYVTIPSDGHYIMIYIFDGVNDYYAPAVFTVNRYNPINSLRDNIADNSDAISKIQADTFITYDIADGDIGELTPLSPVGNAISNIKFHTAGSIQKRKPIFGRIVAVNHDDLQASDYINTRKIYNKYGYNANFNLILMPFASQNEIETKVANVRKLIADGNDLGLHAIMNCSFWWVNPLFDIRPDGTFTFAPTLSELKTVVGNGKNVFGQTVDLTKPLSYYDFVGVPSAYASTAISSLTSTNYSEIIGSYTFFDNTSTATGLDLEGNTQTWALIKWLEYWYNELIDDTLGYTDLGTLSDLYGNYDAPTGATYPDAAHLLAGKIVFYDDTNNPHYSDSSYQIVGKFTKGLYKGAATCCNYEISDRLIKIARAFINHYYGIDKFTSYGRHGVKYVDVKWWNDGVPYDNRDMTVLSSEHGRNYNSIKQRFETGLDVLLENGIKMTGHNTPQKPVFVSQFSLYNGQRENHYPYFAHANVIDYLALAGNSLSDVTGANVTDANLTKILSEQDNILKWAYEKAGQQVSSSDSSVSFYVLTDLKNAIDVIREKLPTGKIPMLSLDTITQKATNYYALELLCYYCYQNGIDIVPFETAREIAMSTDMTTKNNYFPNPNFDSTALIMCGGSSTANSAYRPDGWAYGDGNKSYSVETDDGHRVLTITAGSLSGDHFDSVSVWGIPAGTYEFSCYAKQIGTHGAISVYKYSNGSKVDIGSFVDQVEPEATYQKVTMQFTIPTFEHHFPDSTAESQYSYGYENNVAMVKINVGLFGVGSNSGEAISIYNPVIKKVVE